MNRGEASRHSVSCRSREPASAARAEGHPALLRWEMTGPILAVQGLLDQGKEFGFYPKSNGFEFPSGLWPMQSDSHSNRWPQLQGEWGMVEAKEKDENQLSECSEGAAQGC